jgi:predicted metal-dependent hydrolase
VRNVDDKQEAANMLANMRSRLEKLIQNIEMNYPNDPKVKRLVNKFNPDRISESLRGSKYTSYSINKGEKIVLCLRSKDITQKLTDINTLMFVTLHELAHIMTVSIGHTKEFWSNFKFILKIAVQIGVYDNIDYSQNPQPYCGIEVNDSPLHNKSID